MKLKEKQSEQKLRGAYYTPNEIINFILRWVLREDEPKKILEPSAGDGRFIKLADQINTNSEITAIEINEEESKKIPQNIDCKVNVLNMDFYQYYEEFRNTVSYDAIFGNPPYIRYQFLTEEQREFQSDILKNNRLRPNKLINSWVAFTVASIELLKPGGKFAFVLPTDLLQVSYAKQLREYLQRSFSELNIVTFKNLIFDNIQQDVLILLGIKKSSDKENNSFNLRTLHINQISELDVDLNEYEFDTYTNLSSDKWSTLNLDRNFREYYDGELQELSVSITEFAKIEVGITTGNNKFFAVSDEIVRDYELTQYAIPLLGRSIEVSGVTFTKKDFQKNIKNEKNTWLLDFNGRKLNERAIEYIKIGEDNKENQGYKIRIRDVWYEVPSIWSPDAFLLRRIGQFPKLILNEIGAVSTDTFHRLKLLKDSPYNVYEIIFLFYSSVSLLSIELEGRRFGGGALEILPGDMKNVRLPKISYLKNGKQLFNELDEKFRIGESIYDIVKWVDDQLRANSDAEIDFKTTFNAWNLKNSERYRF